MQIVTREMRRQLERENARQPLVLRPVPAEQWPDLSNMKNKPCQVWRSRHYLVQIFDEVDGVLRISANRTTARPDGRWDDGLTWDELQDIKRQLGMADRYAVEVYPRDSDVVNVANMRHLWVLPEPLGIGWFKREG